jgi:hypothetical protein
MDTESVSWAIGGHQKYPLDLVGSRDAYGYIIIELLEGERGFTVKLKG